MKSAGGKIYSLKDIVFPEDYYIKAYTAHGTALSEIKFFYTGEKSSGDYDLILANGNSKSSVAISSDAPVLVRTMVTARSYRECSSWNIVDWESCLRKNVDEKLIDFSQRVTGPKKYSIPVEEINAGECYCVIAHFADGSTAMSEVMQK